MVSIKLFRITVMVFIFFMIQNILFAQELPEPDFTEIPYYLNGGKLNALKKVETSLSKRAKGMGYGGVETFYEVVGDKASDRFNSEVPISFVIKIEDNRDPSENFSVVIAEIKKNKRLFVTGKIATVFGSNNLKIDRRIPISFKKIRDRIFEIDFPKSLSIGEYAIIPTQKNGSMVSGSQSINIYCFGVD